MQLNTTIRHSSILAWKIPWTEEPGRLQSMGSQRVGHDWATFTFTFFGPHGLYSPWNSPGQDTGVGSLSLLQGIFPTQGLNTGFRHCRRILYQLSHKGSPYTLNVQVKLLSPIWLFVTLWTVALQPPPPFMGFSRQEYCSGLSFFLSRGFSLPRDWTQVSHIAVRLFTLWATKKSHYILQNG